MLVPAPCAHTSSSRELLRAFAELGQAGSLDPATIRALCAAFARFVNRAPFEPGAPYARDVVFDGAVGEAMLARWRTGVPCAPHDHGFARGAVLVVRGCFVERRYRFDGSSLAREHVARFAAGEVVHVDADVIHDMECVEGPGATLHCYAPSPGATRLYDAARGETLTVAPGTGAWLPASRPTDIVAWTRARPRSSA